MLRPDDGRSCGVQEIFVARKGHQKAVMELKATGGGTELPQISHPQHTDSARAADYVLIVTLFVIAMIGGYVVRAALRIPDRNFLVDLKISYFWPSIILIIIITFSAVAQCYFWEKFRLPFGATLFVYLLSSANGSTATLVSGHRISCQLTWYVQPH